MKLLKMMKIKNKAYLERLTNEALDENEDTIYALLKVLDTLIVDRCSFLHKLLLVVLCTLIAQCLVLLLVLFY